MPVSYPENTAPRGLAWIFGSGLGPQVYFAPEDEMGGGAGGEVSASEPQDGNDPADSSNAEQDQGAKSLLDVVSTTLAGEKESSPDSEPGKNPVDPNVAPADAEPPKGPMEDPTEDELKRYKPQTAERMRDLLGQRDTVRKEVETLKPQAEALGQIREFCQSAGLSSQEVDQTFNIASLIKNDPAQALPLVNAIRDQLMGVVGEVLPEDLREQVRLGYISERNAIELSRARAGQTMSQAREVQTRQQAEQREQAARTQREIGDARDALNGWEASKRGNDPDWHLKRERLDEQLELRMRREGRRPQSKQEATSWADEALKRVDAEFARFRPRPSEVRTPTGRASGNTAPQPKSMRDVIDFALGG